MEMRRPPQREQTDLNAMRGTVLGQMRYTDVQVQDLHPLQRFFIKLAISLNVGSWLLLWAGFRFKDLFPPHDAPFMSAVGWYFFFGGLYALFAQLSFKFALDVEKKAIGRSLAVNRRYEWHSHYNTSQVSKEDIRKVPDAPKQVKTSEAVNAGSNYFRITSFLVAAGLAAWLLGVKVIFADLL